MRIRDIMTADPVTVSPDTGLVEVARLMAERDIGAIPVVDDEDGLRPVGVITDRDITTRVVARGQNPSTTRVRDAMTPETITVTPDTSVEDASRAMAHRQVRRLIVVDEGGRCQGVVAQADLALQAPPQQTGRVVRGREKSVTDGPFLEAKDLVAGLAFIQATDLDQATELAQGCPILMDGGTVEIRPAS